jgi:hypothetical protein
MKQASKQTNSPETETMRNRENRSSSLERNENFKHQNSNENAEPHRKHYVDVHIERGGERERKRIREM